MSIPTKASSLWAFFALCVLSMLTVSATYAVENVFTDKVKAPELCLGNECRTSWVEVVNSTGTVSSQWTQGTGNISYNAGNVGIGTTNPDTPLYITSPSTSGTGRSILTLNTEESTHNTSSYLDFAQAKTVTGRISNVFEGPAQIGMAFSAYNNLDGDGLVEHLRVNSDGNVGIGTTTPASKLSVSGAISSIGISSNINSGGMSIDFDSINNIGRVITSNPSTNAMGFYVGAASNATEKVRITSDGNVGIGTTNPKYKLDVEGNARLGSLYVNGNEINTYSGTPVVIGARRMADMGTSSRAELRVMTGIGINVPTFSPLESALHIISEGTTGVNDAIIVGSNGDGGAGRGQAILMRQPNSDGVGIDAVRMSAVDNGLTLQTGQAGVLADRLRIDKDGNVGIGTSSPTEALSVVGRRTALNEGISINGGIWNSREAGGAIYFSNVNANKDIAMASIKSHLLHAGGGGEQGSLSFSTGQNERMRIANTGNVGIGTTTPTEKLEVIGNVKASGFCIGDECKNSWAEAISGVVESDPQIASRNLDKITVTSGGNLGIGTTNPSAKLEIIDNSTSEAGFVLKSSNHATYGAAPGVVSNMLVYSEDSFGDDVGATIGIGGKFDTDRYSTFAGISGVKANATDGNSDGELIFSTRLGTPLVERMRINSNGNVGIGTTTPGATLDVVGEVRVPGVGQIGPVDKLGFAFFKAGTNQIAGQLYGKTEGGLQFTNSLGANTLALDESGNIGIGTTTPLRKLSIVESGDNPGLFLESSNYAGIHYKVLDHNWHGGVDNDGQFYLWNKEDDKRHFTVNKGGNIGIGTTNPGSELSIGGGTSDFNINNVSASEGLVDLDLNGLIQQGITKSGRLIRMDNRPGQPAISFWTRAANEAYATSQQSMKMSILENGNVGIGTTTPTEKLTVNGNIQLSGQIKGVASPTADDHATNKKYVDDAINGLSWKEPVEAKTDLGTCVTDDKANARYVKNEDAIYVCNGTAWVIMSSTAGVPTANSTVAGKIAISGVLDGTADNVQIKDGSLVNADISDTANIDLDKTNGIINTKLEIAGNQGDSNQRNFKVTYGPNQGNLADTEFSALAHNIASVGGNGWTALYAKQGAANKAGFFDGDVTMNGNVGIGTTDPKTPLDIRSDTNPVITVGTNDGVGGALYLGNINHGLMRGGGDIGGNDVTMYTGGDGLNFATTGVPYGIPNRSNIKMRIANNGNVGIGTTDPNSKLHISGDSGTVSDGLIIKSATGGNQYGIYSSLHNFHFRSVTAGIDAMTISYDGNVGIGTTAPVAKLDVDGGIALAIKTVTADYTATNNDYFILCDASTGNKTVTLPNTTTVTGLEINVKKIDGSANTCTIATNGTQKIDGRDAQIIATQYESYSVMTDGAAWWIK